MDEVKIGFPIEYEDENNIVRNGLFLREPEIKELKKRLKEINRIIDLKQQIKMQKEAIDKAIEYINHFSKESEVKIYGLPKCKVFIGDIEQLLDILKEVSE